MIYLNGTKVTPTIFPDKTSQVWNLTSIRTQSRDENIVKWVFENESEFMYLAQLAMLLSMEDIDYSLELPYLPYGRQDKEISNNTTFALRTFAYLLNELNFSQVVIRDAHSEVALELINYSRSYFMTETLNNLLNNYTTVCFPDAGACDRYNEYFPDYNIVNGSKQRDQQTGYITSYSFKGDVKDRNILIIDDICDGGMTFIILAKSLLEAGANQVDLYVSHGIFSKGKQVLHDSGITNIYTP